MKKVKGSISYPYRDFDDYMSHGHNPEDTRGIHRMMADNDIAGKYIPGWIQSTKFANRVYRIIDKNGWTGQRMIERKRQYHGYKCMAAWHRSLKRGTIIHN